MKHLFFLMISIGFFITTFGQEMSTNKKTHRQEKQQRIDAIVKQEEEGVLKFKKQFVAGFKLTNDGAGGFLEFAKAQTKTKGLLFQLEFTERKHVKEEKLQNELSSTSPLIYGKINYFYPIKLGVQKQYLLGNKSNKNGVSVTANFGGGFSLGLLRPYLVEVDKGNGNYAFVGYNSPDSNYFLNGPIVGGPSLSYGWNQLKIVPGFYLKPAVRFDYGKYNEMVSAVEIGATAEYYFKKIQQMINVKQHQFFLGAYVALVFGRRK
jgi:hypothetical protein